MNQLTAIVTAGLLVASAMGALGAIREIPVTKMEALVRQGALDGLGGLRDIGTSGMRPKLERCYRRVSQSHDQTAAVYCMTEDRVITDATVKLFRKRRLVFQQSGLCPPWRESNKRSRATCLSTSNFRAHVGRRPVRCTRSAAERG